MATQTSDSPTRGYSATKDQLLKRLRRVGTTAELMAAVGRLMRRG